MEFQAELIEVKSKKTADLDNTYRLVFQTNNPEILGLGALSPETIFHVKVTADSDA